MFALKSYNQENFHSEIWLNDMDLHAKRNLYTCMLEWNAGIYLARISYVGNKLYWPGALTSLINRITAREIASKNQQVRR